MKNLKQTIIALVLDHLTNIGPLTSKEALGAYGTYHLQDAIYKLRMQGYRIKTVIKQDSKRNLQGEYHLLNDKPSENKYIPKKYVYSGTRASVLIELEKARRQVQKLTEQLLNVEATLT